MKPNILCLVSEDCPPLLSSYGNDVAHTPHLDQLASEGITFENAYCSSPVCAPSRFAILTGRMAEASAPAHHMRSLGPAPSDTLTVPEMLRDAGYYCINNSKTDYNYNVDPNLIWDDCSAVAHWNNRPTGTPFFAVFNSMVTHESCVFDESPLEFHPKDMTVPLHLPDLPSMRETIARYYSAVSRMDDELGARLRELDDSGLTNDTIILYYSDHGSPLPRSKRFCYDEGLRVPLVLRLPNRWRSLLPQVPGSQVLSPVSLVDLMPSLALMAGIEAPDSIHGQPFIGEQHRPRKFVFSGRDRMDERYDLTRTVRSERFRYIRNYAPHRPWGQHYAYAWLSTAYQDYERQWLDRKLCEQKARFWRHKPAEELYDSASDPNSINNLVEDSHYSEALAEMQAALDSHMLSICDMGFIPELSDIETLEASRDPALYPLEEVIDLASKAIRRDPATAEIFKELLDNDKMILRFWAAQGLLMLAIEGYAPPFSLLPYLTSERNPQVRVVLAEILGHLGETNYATEVLLGYLDNSTNSRLKLQVLNALTYFVPMSELVLPRLVQLAKNSDPYIRNASEYLRLKLNGQYDPSSVIFRLDLMAK